MSSPSASRAASVRLVGGRACLDLVNTISWRGDPARREDHLVGRDDCLVWCGRTGVLSPDEQAALGRSRPPGADRLVSSLHEVREVVTRALVASDPPDLDRLRPLVADAIAHSSLTPTDAGARWQVETLDDETAARRLALDALDLLQGAPPRIATCADQACAWAFVDTSRRQDRRWCSSQDCGNRDRARRHHARSAGR